MVAEKPSISETIAKMLSNGNFRTQKRQTPVHFFNGTFQNRKAEVCVTAVTGHVFNRDFPSEYQNWSKTDPSTLFAANTIKSSADDKGKIEQHLRSCAHDKDVLVLWLDNDREGENICFEVLDCVYKLLSPQPYRRVYRAHFYSLVESELKQSYSNLNEGPDLFLSLSVDARQIIDLKVGVAFTRYQSMFLKDRYIEFKDKVISYGPCQTPTLGLVVSRDKQIKDFKT